MLYLLFKISFWEGGLGVGCPSPANVIFVISMCVCVLLGGISPQLRYFNIAIDDSMMIVG